MAITLFLCGDVMTGRGIDQILPHPNDPRIHEPSLRSALGYVALAETKSGAIPRPVDFAYVWGDALVEFERVAPDAKIINLETAVTRSDDAWRGKGINYRMHPDNVLCLTSARIDCCVLANNHVLDWGYSGLRETLETLRRAHIRAAGAGGNAEEAAAPAVLDIAGKGAVVVFSFGLESSGIAWPWRASVDRPGVNLLPDLSDERVREIAARVREWKRARTIVVASIHWGENWGYDVPASQREFAHKLIDGAGIDVVHGHSSHHPKGIEVYRDRPILYGCGDFLNDYEGIGGYEEFPTDLALMYFPSLDPETGRLARFEMTPTRIQRFRVRRASTDEARRLSEILSREGEKFGSRVRLNQDNTLTLERSGE
jgi:poly-gamma-glutamate capsule biosynthesis protein CapA/YwtB (metallophosphatase superfamily)